MRFIVGQLLTSYKITKLNRHRQIPFDKIILSKKLYIIFESVRRKEITKNIQDVG